MIETKGAPQLPSTFPNHLNQPGSDIIRLYRLFHVKQIAKAESSCAPRRTHRATILPLVLGAFLLLGTACAPVEAAAGWGAPIATGDLILTSNSQGKVTALRTANDALPAVAWTYPPPSESEKPWYQRLFSGRSDEAALQTIYAAPIVGRAGQQQRIYLAGYSGVVLAIDPTTGRRIDGWPSVNAGSRIIATPAFADGRLYIATQEGTVRSIDAATGALSQPFLSLGTRIWSAPVIDRGTLYIAAFDHHVRALDPLTGAVRWQQDIGGAVAGDLAFTGDLMLVPTLQSRLVALDTTARGAERWAFTGDNWFWARPLVSGDTVFAVSSVGTVYALDVATGRERWNTPVKAGEVHAAPVIVGGTLVVATRNGVLAGLDPTTGAERWRKTVEDARFLANPLVVESAILYVAENGDVHRVRPQDKGTTERMFSPDN